MRRRREYVTTEHATAEAVATLRQHLPGIPGVRGRLEDVECELTRAATSSWFRLEWERSWGVGCTLSLDWRAGETEVEDDRVVAHMSPSVQVSWSSSGRTPAAAVACAALYTQVAALACLLEAQLSQLHVAAVREKATPVAEVTS